MINVCSGSVVSILPLLPTPANSLSATGGGTTWLTSILNFALKTCPPISPLTSGFNHSLKTNVSFSLASNLPL